MAAYWFFGTIYANLPKFHHKKTKLKPVIAQADCPSYEEQS
jgi:hypothetical protein